MYINIVYFTNSEGYYILSREHDGKTYCIKAKKDEKKRGSRKKPLAFKLKKISDMGKPPTRALFKDVDDKSGGYKIMKISKKKEGIAGEDMYMAKYETESKEHGSAERDTKHQRREQASPIPVLTKEKANAIGFIFSCQ